MNARELKELFITFFVGKNHVEIPSASLIPENDPTTLFISAGMHPLVPYLLGQPHPAGKRLVNVQKCLRTGDIDSVGDTFHHTFFEMLGNWSLGDYFKQESIPWSFEFLTQKLDINPKNLHVTIFAGDTNAPIDEESRKLWLKQGILPEHIHPLGVEDNWWSPAGTTGPCGPDTEIFFDTQFGQPDIDFKAGCQSGRYIEIWNNVFIQFNKTAEAKLLPLTAPNVDTGMGVERTIAVLSGLSDNYLTPVFQSTIQAIETISSHKYSNNPIPFRIIDDHLRAAVFLLADGVEVSNKDRGYVLRRLIRRSIRQGKILGINQNFCVHLGQIIINNASNFAGDYPELSQHQPSILTALEAEEIKFRRTLDKGLNKITQLINRQKSLSGADAFDLYQSFGFPLELIQEELQKHKLTLDLEEFNCLKAEHQKQSQTLSAGIFKSGLADHSEIITKYHTATHLLHASLRKILGPEVHQSGSNITSERLRFDFTYPQKLTPTQLQDIEDLVNQQIKNSLPISHISESFQTAQASGALAFFGTKYPDIVTVYTVGDTNNPFSQEVCTGPHVENTHVLGHFKITREESAGSGKRRIYAILN